MISSQDEYLSKLYDIQEEGFRNRSHVIILPEYEPMINIDLESRKIEAPNFISVQRDNKAETVICSVNRFFGRTDLTLTSIIIQYINANGDSRIYPIEHLDVSTKHNEGKMLFPWQLGNEATAYAGILKFAVSFYTIDPVSHKMLFCLNTKPAEMNVLNGLEGHSDPLALEVYNASTLKSIYDKIQQLQGTHQTYWSFASQIGVEENGTPTIEITNTI